MTQLPNGDFIRTREDGAFMILGFHDCPKCSTVRFVHIQRGDGTHCSICEVIQPLEAIRG